MAEPFIKVLADIALEISQLALNSFYAEHPDIKEDIQHTPVEGILLILGACLAVRPLVDVICHILDGDV